MKKIKAENIYPIDWDVVVYRYDPDTRSILVANWHDSKPPLPIAHVMASRPAYVDDFVHRLVNNANEKLATDQLANERKED